MKDLGENPLMFITPLRQIPGELQATPSHGAFLIHPASWPMGHTPMAMDSFPYGEARTQGLLRTRLESVRATQ